jgi:hypothetical protein
VGGDIHEFKQIYREFALVVDRNLCSYFFKFELALYFGRLHGPFGLFSFGFFFAGMIIATG